MRGKTETRKIELSLFDLEADEAESNNVAAAHADIVAQMQELARKFDVSLKSGTRQPAKASGN